MRAFLALPLPDAVRDALAAVQAQVPLGRAVAWENLHLTLAFLGEIATGEVQTVDAAMRGLAAAPVALRLAGLDVFGGRRPRALVAAASGPEAVQGQVVRALRAGGLALERRRFRPHVTLVRFSGGLGRGEAARLARVLEGIGGFALPPVTVDRICLYRSALRPDGAVYEALAAYGLEGNPSG